MTWDRKVSDRVDLEGAVRPSSGGWTCRIMGRTVASVLRRDGITAAGDATMPEFMGSSPGEPLS